ncbi:MAG: serine/threonine protein kinase, partial [Anaerolineae bacterium]|nr:serine/threonine protein kinase [Anaerolineae bacterium]
MSDPLLNQTFAYFEIRERIQAGGMAIVYQAYDTRRKQIIALKILQENLALHGEIVSRFRQEGEIAARLRHPHIVQFFDTDQFENRLYIAMQYMPGGSMADFLNQNPLLKLGRTAQILRQIGSALDYAHLENVVHRDLKLGNILLDDSGNTLLTDFGIARMLDATQVLTNPNQQMPGTVKYMSPEQVRGVLNLDYRSDLYSFAVIAYLLTTGRYPFTGTNDIVVLNQHLNMSPPAPTLVNDDLPAALNDVLLKGLAKQPDQRYLSAGDFADAFTTAIEGYEDLEVLVDMRAENPALPPQPEGSTGNDGTRFGSLDELLGSSPSLAIPATRPQSQGRRGRSLLLLIGLAIVLGTLALINRNGNGIVSGITTETPTTLAPEATTDSSPSATASAAAIEISATVTTSDTPSPIMTDTLTATTTPGDTANVTGTASAASSPTLPPDSSAGDASATTSVSTATSTFTLTLTFTLTPPPPTFTASITPTVIGTLTPTLNVTNTPTFTPTPLFANRQELIAAFNATGTQSDFDCVVFSQAHDFLIAQITAANPEFILLDPLTDAEDDSMNLVYAACQEDENLNNPDVFIQFELYSRLFED